MIAPSLLETLSLPFRLVRALPARILAPLVLGCALTTAAAPASAQELSLHLGKRFGHSEVGLTLSTGHRSVYGHRSSHDYRQVQPGRVWIAGRYETVERRVWVAGHSQRIWVEPVYRTVYDSCGRATTVLARAGRWEWVQRPGHYEVRHVNVWRPGYWSTGGSSRIAAYGYR